MNDGFEYRDVVGPDGDGETLLDYLTRRYRHSPRRTWEARILEGRVRVDGSAATPETRLARGRQVRWSRPPWVEPHAPLSIAVLHRDPDLLAVAKPSGLPTLPGGGFLRSTLLHRVRAVDPRAVPLHRLGRWTSGVVLFATSAEARRDGSARFARREVHKRYRALASGIPERDGWTVDLPIGEVPHPLLGSVHAAVRGGKPARTRIRVVERRAASFVCDVLIESGRPHQIRIHLAAAGHPLLGDPLYADGGRPVPRSRALPGDPGYRLHAAELRLPHPRSGRPVSVHCPPPPVLRVAADDRP